MFSYQSGHIPTCMFVLFFKAFTLLLSRYKQISQHADQRLFKWCECVRARRIIGFCSQETAQPSSSTGFTFCGTVDFRDTEKFRTLCPNDCYIQFVLMISWSNIFSIFRLLVGWSNHRKCSWSGWVSSQSDSRVDVRWYSRCRCGCRHLDEYRSGGIWRNRGKKEVNDVDSFASLFFNMNVFWEETEYHSLGRVLGLNELPVKSYRELAQMCRV